jgi:hypothetical protein
VGTEGAKAADTEIEDAAIEGGETENVRSVYVPGQALEQERSWSNLANRKVDEL